MRKILSLFLILAFLPAVLAINLDINKISKDEVMIIGLDDPAIYELEVTNNGRATELSFYTFFGSGMTPTEAISFDSGETKNISLQVHPRWDLGLIGSPSFEYFVQDNTRSEISEKLNVKILTLEKALETGSASFNPESSSLKIYLKNKVNFNFSELNVDFSSPFFDFEETFSLAPYETKEFEVELKKEDFNKLMAGFYTLLAEVETGNSKAEIESRIEFVEKDLLKTDVKNYGFIVTTKVIRKTNDGNTVLESVEMINKNIISRLFTTFNPEPDLTERTGGKIKYSWEQKISPGESQEIIIKTNWLLPILAIVLIFSTFYFARKYSQQKLSIRKRVTFVKARGGEFALKVTVVAEAREYLEKVRIIERLPPLVNMYERFAGELPDKISKDKKRLEWDFDYLDAGERRVMTYIVYSKVGILGKFALPGTIARFEQQGKEKEATSNKAYFLADQRDRNHYN